MLILLSLAAYLVLGLPVVAWLGHRLAQAHPDHGNPSETLAVAAAAAPVTGLRQTRRRSSSVQRLRGPWPSVVCPPTQVHGRWLGAQVAEARTAPLSASRRVHEWIGQEAVTRS